MLADLLRQAVRSQAEAAAEVDLRAYACLRLLLACCALLGLFKCLQCRLRHCSLCRWCLRMTGLDKFDDFQLWITVHEMAFVSPEVSTTTRVRLVAGEHQAATDAVSGRSVGQVLEMTIEQGTEVLRVDIMDAYSSRVLASVDLNIQEDILEAKEEILERTYDMQEKKKGIKNPRIKLSIKKDSEGKDEERGLAAPGPAPPAAAPAGGRPPAQVRFQRQTIEADAHSTLEEISSGQLMARCCGSLEMQSSWNSKELVYAAVKGPPQRKKYSLGVWKSENSCQNDDKEMLFLDILRIVTVQNHPMSNEAFIINYAETQTEKKSVTFWVVDRPRDSWVKYLALMIQKCREMKGAERTRKGHLAPTDQALSAGPSGSTSRP